MSNHDDLIPEGYYPAVAVRTEGEDGIRLARWGRSAGENKTRQILMYFELLEGPHAGTRLPWFGYFTKASYERTLQSLRYCGMVGDDLASIESEPMDQRVSVAVEHHTYEDRQGTEKTVVRIAWVNRAGSGTIKLADPMSQPDLLKFAAQMKAKLAAVPIAKGEKAAPAEKAASGSSGQGTPAPASDRPAWMDEGPSHADEATDPMAHGMDDDIPF